MSFAQSLMVYAAQDLIVVEGASFGDKMGDISQLVPADVFELRKSARPHRLALAHDAATNGPVVAAPGGICAPGSLVDVLGDITLMATQDGTPCPAIMLATKADTGPRALWVMCFGVLKPGRAYTLIHSNPGPANSLISQLGSASFVRGTGVLMAHGGQKPIETLVQGEMVMTRSHGPQPISHTSRQTVRAEGPLAPIVIAKGALNTARDLWLSPHHRLFIHQRRDHLGIGRKETTMQAEMLVNGVDVVQKPGGFLDYHELVFERPEIIFVEGIAAESRFEPVLDAGRSPRVRSARARVFQLNHGDVSRQIDPALVRHATKGTTPELSDRDRS